MVLRICLKINATSIKEKLECHLGVFVALVVANLYRKYKALDQRL